MVAILDEDSIEKQAECYSSDSENSKCIREIKQTLTKKKTGKRYPSLIENKKNLVKSSSIQYIVSALANMKSAANFVLQKKDCDWPN